MTTLTTARIYTLSGSAAGGWIVTGGNPSLVYEVSDSTDDEQLTGSVSGTRTIGSSSYTFNGTYVGSFGNGLVILIASDNRHYLLTNDGPYATGFSFQSSASPFVVCFAAGTEIATPSGSIRVEALHAGDLVPTKDHGPQAIRWIGSKKLDHVALSLSPHLRPICIRAGALGDSCPEYDLIVSPQHRILVRSKIAQKMFGTDEVLVAAKQLLMIDGIDIADDLEEVEYFHFLFDRHEVVISNGAETESLFTGPEALKAVGEVAREEILTFFPELEHRDYKAEPARMLLSGRIARRMASRHHENGKMLVS